VAYRWGEHVGELELAIEAGSEHEVFADATRAFGELLTEDDEPPAAPQSHGVSARAHDRAALLAEYLEELIFLAETEGFVPRELERLELAGDALQARVGGDRGEPPHLVKAVTRHRLAFEPAERGWRANVLLDV
jgi:SHS2 domain-containing protein